ncbi:hypothetical protein JCM14469_38320 [Desulfatiferula olefinivorans]
MTGKMTGVIAAAGEGSRLYPASKRRSKVVLTVDGVPLISRIVSIMHEQLRLDTIHVIVGKNRQAVEEVLKPFVRSGLDIRYIDNPEPETGLARGLLPVEPLVDGPFCLMLSDEVYQNADHHRLVDLFGRDFSAICCVKQNATPREIRKNYMVEMTGDRVSRLIEKPVGAIPGVMGCGTFVFTAEIFRAIRMTAPSPRSGIVELVDAVDFLIRSGKTVLPFFLDGDYVNVNTADDLNRANHLVRGRAFDRKTVSLVIPAFNEEASIGHVIDDFKPHVAEIIVADNRSKDRTADIAREKGALVFSRRLKGYGHAIRYGMSRATGDILVITEADGSFAARDLGKILEYMKDADMVIGTRTTKQMIEQGANMNFFLRFGNAAAAKIIEMLWWNRNEPRLTDVGCTYRAIWRDAWGRIRDDLNADGPAFSPEMIIETIRHYLRVIEIPLTYHGRIGGESKHSKGLFQVLRTGFSMLALIFRKRLVYLLIDDLMDWLDDRRREW